MKAEGRSVVWPSLRYKPTKVAHSVPLLKKKWKLFTQLHIVIAIAKGFIRFTDLTLKKTTGKCWYLVEFSDDPLAVWQPDLYGG